MKYWSLFAKLAGAAWLAVAAAIFAALAPRFYRETGWSAAFIGVILFSAAHAMWFLVICWQALIRKVVRPQGAVDEGGSVSKSSGTRRAIFAVASLLSFASVLLAVSYMVRVVQLQDSI